MKGKFIFYLFVFFIFVSITWAIPIPDYSLHGKITYLGQELTEQDTSYNLVLKVDNTELVSFNMGDVSADEYFIKVPLDSDCDVAESACEGDSAYLYVNDNPIDQNPITIGSMGELVELDISVSSIEDTNVNTGTANDGNEESTTTTVLDSESTTTTLEDSESTTTSTSATTTTIADNPESTTTTIPEQASGSGTSNILLIIGGIVILAIIIVLISLIIRKRKL